MTILYTKHYLSGSQRGLYRDAILHVGSNEAAVRQIQIMRQHPRFVLTDVRVIEGTIH
jgi:hypothetical protein